MLARFLLYGCAGWVLEIGFTGVSNALFQKDTHGTARTFLWMHPIYGGTALALEGLHTRLHRLPRPLRALAYTAVIYAAEYGAGWLLCKLLGRCPWDYARRGWSVKGLVRLDYFPAWYATALLFEPVREKLLDVTAQALRTTPEHQEAMAQRSAALPPAPEGELDDRALASV